jgi:hypothetical protein
MELNRRNGGPRTAFHVNVIVKVVVVFSRWYAPSADRNRERTWVLYLANKNNLIINRTKNRNSAEKDRH